VKLSRPFVELKTKAETVELETTEKGELQTATVAVKLAFRLRLSVTFRRS
jgi:hypothetical protein